MHSVVCRLVLRPDPTGGAYSAPLAGLWGGAAWGRGTREGRGKERGRERKGRNGKGEDWMRGEAGHSDIFRWIDPFG